ncbi:MAG: RES domain-containing protein [Myxococcales bacterium]|nr:RES domain-containing protein [Myxococcales bacterium]
MSKFPEPPTPAELAALGAEWKLLAVETELWRIYFRGGPFPARWNTLREFGPTASRFDHHLPPARTQERAILYAALHGPTCVAEVFQDTRLVDRRRGAPWLCSFRVARPLRLLDLTGAWPTRAGASTAIHSGLRARARRWSQHLYAAFPEAEGLLYCASMDGNRPAVALYERGATALPPQPEFHKPLDDPQLTRPLNHAANAFGYGMV